MRLLVNTLLDTLALLSGCGALFFVARVRKTYFLDSRFFIGIANIAFNIILVQDLVSDLILVPPSQSVFVVAIVVTAVSIGFASYIMEKDPATSGFSELKSFLSRPPRALLTYLSVVAGWGVFGLLLEPWSLERSVNGVPAFYYSYQTWYLVLSSLLLIAFVGMPVANLYRQSTTLSDFTAARSLKIISFSWSGFGVVSLFQVIIPSTQAIGDIADGLLFVLVAFALREPTVLSRIISSHSPRSHAVVSSLAADAIMLYESDSDRRRLVEAFIREQWKSGRKAACYVTESDVPFYSMILKELSSSSSLGGVEEIPVRSIDRLSRSTSGESLQSMPERESQLLDLGEIGSEQSRLIIEAVRGSSALPTKNTRVWVANREKTQPTTLGLIRDMNPKNEIVDQASRQNSFSSLLGLDQHDATECRLLLEFDPCGAFEDAVANFAEEVLSNGETVAIFTSLGSPVQRRIGNRPEFSLFSFSSKTSTPSRRSEREVLLPERESSLLLDAVDKLLQANKGQHVSLAFDIFSDLALLQGFEKAYSVLSSVLEMAESESATTLVLLNQTAHDERVLSGVRGLFVSQILCDTNGIRLVRFQRSEAHWRLDDARSSLSEPSMRGVGGS